MAETTNEDIERLIEQEKEITNQIIRDPSLQIPDLPLEPRKFILWTSNFIQRAISHIFGYDRAAQKQRAVSVDSDGRIYVNSAPVTRATATNTQVTVTTAPTLIITANTARSQLAIENIGSVDLYIGFTTAISTANGFRLAPGQGMSFDIFTGAVFGVSASGTVQVCIVEI